MSSPTPLESSQSTSILNVIGHILFFSAFFVLNNPFFLLETTARFSVFLFMIASGGGLIIFQHVGRVYTRLPLTFFITLLFLIMFLRRTEVGSLADTSNNEQIYQSILALFVLILSISITDVFNLKIIKNVFLVSSFLCVIPICLNYQDLFDFEQQNSFELGTLSFNNYQIVSHLLGIFIIVSASYIREIRGPLVFRLFLFIMILVCIYVMFQGYARGEVFALLISLAVYVFGTSIGIILLISLLPAISFLISYIDTPLTQRAAVILQGDFGERDILFGQATSAVFSDLSIFAVGGGANYFQSLYNYPFEMYPHNIFLEALISGGILLAGALAWIYLRPLGLYIFKSKRTPDESFLFGISLFVLLIYMKSGSIISFWGLGSIACLFLRLEALKSVANRQELRRGQTIANRQASDDFGRTT
jgi:O-antigen ligase